MMDKKWWRYITWSSRSHELNKQTQENNDDDILHDPLDHMT